MSTRATYNFKNGDNRFPINVTIYIHHDGYLSGAAYHFHNALSLPLGGHLPERLIRSNAEAELTQSHDIHGDTNYRYDVVGNGPTASLTAYKRTYAERPTETDQWNLVYTGTVVDFINSFGKQDLPKFKPVTMYYGEKVWLNEITAKHRLGPATDGSLDSSIMGHLLAWKKHKSTEQTSANWQGMLANYHRIVQAFPTLAIPNFTEEYGELLPAYR